jgi:WD40 repeat protein
VATPTWTPSTFYATGSLVQPATTQPAVPTSIPNPSFESGNVEWTLDAGLSIVNGVEHFGPGTWSLQANTGFAGERWAEMQDFIPCVPGENITAKCQIQQGASSFGNTGGAVGLRFYDALNALIQDFRGNEVIDGSGGAWHQSSVTAGAPANTASVRIYIYMKRVNQNLPFWADAVEWNKISQAQSGLIFRAVQPTVGLSGSVEPVWPLVNGAQVIDNEVIWEATLATRVTWEAHAILVSGATEPVFPAQEGGTIGDNAIAWRAVSRRITDPNCPNSKIVVIAASKVFAADDDIVAYSATVNPLDWSTADDAGYLPTNLQQYGANPVSGIGLYRGNLVPMNTQGSQVWQIDEDPAQMALLDAFPVGTAYHTSISPAFNDLFFAASLGVRTTGIAGASTNLQSGDAGMPIDPLVQEALRDAVVEGNEVNSLYYPAAGQYWLMFSPPAVPTGPITLSGELSDGIQNNAYSSGPLTVGNGFAPYRWSATNLPTGLTINEFTGIVSGTPTVIGTFGSVMVTVVDRFGRMATRPQSIDIAFSANLILARTNAISVRSGLTSAYTEIQSLVTSGGAVLDVAMTNGAEYIALCLTNAPFFGLFKRNSLGAYLDDSVNVSPLPAASVQAVAFTQDGAYMAIRLGSTEMRLYKFDGTTFTQVSSVTSSNIAGHMSWDPTGTYIATGGAGNLGRIWTRTGDTLALTQGINLAGSSGGGTAWRGSRVVFSGTLRHAVYQMIGGTATLLDDINPPAAGNADIVWSPDGQFLFVSNVTAPFLTAFSWNGVTLTQLANPPQPAFSPTTVPTISMTSDGRFLAVTSSNAAAGTVVYSVSGGTLTQVLVIPFGVSNSNAFATSTDYMP